MNKALKVCDLRILMNGFKNLYTSYEKFEIYFMLNFGNFHIRSRITAVVNFGVCSSS